MRMRDQSYKECERTEILPPARRLYAEPVLGIPHKVARLFESVVRVEIFVVIRSLRGDSVIVFDNVGEDEWRDRSGPFCLSNETFQQHQLFATSFFPLVTAGMVHGRSREPAGVYDVGLLANFFDEDLNIDRCSRRHI